MKNLCLWGTHIRDKAKALVEEAWGNQVNGWRDYHWLIEDHKPHKAQEEGEEAMPFEVETGCESDDDDDDHSGNSGGSSADDVCDSDGGSHGDGGGLGYEPQAESEDDVGEGVEHQEVGDDIDVISPPCQGRGKATPGSDYGENDCSHDAEWLGDGSLPGGYEPHLFPK